MACGIVCAAASNSACARHSLKLGKTALHVSADADFFEVASILLDGGADIEALDEVCAATVQSFG